MTGSHSDTVVLGGPYDGALGVLGAINAVKALKNLGFEPVRSIEAIMFTTEEASRFSIPCLGRLVSNRLPNSNQACEFSMCTAKLT
jgi:hypothetical protein